MAGVANGYPNTGTQPSASMCAVQANGLAPIGDGPPEPADYSTACSCNAVVSSVVTMAPTVVIGMNSDGSLWSETATVKTVTNPAYTPPTDCCVECLITAADVQILYWPIETASTNNLSTANNMSITAAPPAPTPYSYVENGVTFISPSVYVAYRSLGAAEDCPAFGPEYFAQGDSYNTTIGYPPDALSTSMCDGPPAGFQLYTAINYTELQYPTGSQTQGTCEWRIGSSGTPRGPYLSIPTNVKNVNPAWSTCSGAFEGSFDPPSALKKATALVAQTPGPDKVPSATPGPSIAPVNAPPTPTPGPVDPGSSGQQSAPASPGTAKANAPSPDPTNPDAGNAGITNADPGDLANPPANVNNGNPAASVAVSNPGPSQSGVQGSSDSVQNSDPSNPQPAGGNAGTDPGTGTGSTGAGDPMTGTGTTPAPNSVVANGNTIVRDPNGGVVVGSSTVMPGSTAQIAGASVSVGSGHVIIGSSSYALPAAPTANAVLIESQPIVRASNGGVTIGSSTVAPGVQTVVAGHTVSVGSSHAVVDGSTYTLPSSVGAVVQAAPAPSTLLVSGQSIVRALNGGILIGSSTIALGALATIAGHAVSVGSSAAVIDGTTYALPTSPGAILHQAPNLAQNIALNSKVTLANGAVITAGGSPATVGGTAVAIPSNENGLIVNGKTVPLLTAAPTSVFKVAGEIFTAAPTGFAIGGQTLSPGGSAITISGTEMSLGPSGLQIGTSTIPLPSGAATSVFTVAGQTFTAAPTGFAIGRQKLSPGGSAITLSGTVVSLGPSGLQIGSSILPLPSATNSVFTVAGQTFTAAPTGFAVDGQTISPGGSAITLSGTVVSLGPSGLQIGSSTVALPSPLPSIFTVAGQTFTAAPTGFAIGSQTLVPGGSAITLSGTVLSLGPSGLEIGASTVPLTPAEQSADASAGLGALIMGGYGSNPTGGASNGTGLVGFTGSGSRLGIRWQSLGLAIGLVVGLVMFIVSEIPCW